MPCAAAGQHQEVKPAFGHLGYSRSLRILALGLCLTPTPCLTPLTEACGVIQLNELVGEFRVEKLVKHHGSPMTILPEQNPQWSPAAPSPPLFFPPRVDLAVFGLLFNPIVS